MTTQVNISHPSNSGSSIRVATVQTGAGNETVQDIHPGQAGTFWVHTGQSLYISELNPDAVAEEPEAPEGDPAETAIAMDMAKAARETVAALAVATFNANAGDADAGLAEGVSPDGIADHAALPEEPAIPALSDADSVVSADVVAAADAAEMQPA